MPQIQRFDNGGFVIHKATIGASRCTFSAWFDADGNLIDAEGRAANGSHRPFVKRGGKVWNELSGLARIYGGR